jgi:hypothetical protein
MSLLCSRPWVVKANDRIIGSSAKDKQCAGPIANEFIRIKDVRQGLSMMFAWCEGFSQCRMKKANYRHGAGKFGSVREETQLDGWSKNEFHEDFHSLLRQNGGRMCLIIL